jgi:hypothetical protein
VNGRRGFLALLIAGAVLLQAPVAAAAPALDFSDDRTPDPYVHSSEEEIAAHDLGEMDSPLELENDEGEVTELPATYNQSQDTPFGVRFDKVEAQPYYLFPRIDSEEDNGATWTETGQWTTNADASVSDADADGVDKVQVDATAAGGNATFAQNVSLTQDPNKRVLLFVGNVDTLNTAEVQVRVTDSDGDYRYANISSSDDADADYTIANSTGNGFVFQEKVGDLPMGGSGDGTLDGIQQVEIVSVGDTSTVTVAGLDVDRKSTIDFAEIERDTDDDGDLETTTFQSYHEGGVANLTSYEFGSDLSNAIIHDWKVYDVRYPLSELSDSDQYETEFMDDSESSYPKALEVTADVQAPNYIDLSHGSLSLKIEQGLIADRWADLRVSSDVSSDTAIGDLNDSDYTSKTGNVSTKGDTLTLLQSVNGDTEYRVDLKIYLKDDEVDALSAPGGMGPTGDSGGFFSTLQGQVFGVVAAVGSFLGLRRLFGGS